MSNHKCRYESIYQEIGKLGKGGNATVLHVKNKKNNKDFALKLLTNKQFYEKKQRFTDEIKIMVNNYKEIEGVMPIYDFSYNEYWYSMPIATPILDHLEKKTSINEIVLGIIQLCETLEKLHEKGISHRDIKPSNIYYYNDRFCFGDFGLVDFPDNINNLTRSDRGLGAIFTIAPEMKRNPKDADGKKADVFSLAKTMWMLLTKNEKGYDGVYNFQDSTHGLHFIKDYKDIHLVEIEELFQESTNNDPNLRPTIKEFKEKLLLWIEIISDLNKSQASDWKFLNKQLFGLYPPDSSSWQDINSIVEILNIITSIPAYNHMLFHTNGGLDLFYAKKANEDNCIKLYDTIGFCYIVKPKRLYFEGFNKNYKWNYFLLELDELEPILETPVYFDRENLVEDIPGHYVSAQYAQYGVYDYDSGMLLPKGFEVIERFVKGRIMIVMKTGPYNGINGTYDGRHGDCTIDEFRRYIDNLVKYYSKAYTYIKQNKEFNNLSEDEIEARILRLEFFNKNPFSEKVNHIEELRIKEKIKQEEMISKYIESNFMNWNFTDIISEYIDSASTNIKFTFKFKAIDNDIFDLISDKCYYLCKDGYIKKLKLSIDDCFSLSDRTKAIEMQNMLTKRVIDFLQERELAELKKYESYFSISLVRNGRPSHLFTKEEIQYVMMQADDRVNNQLVIDENGYAHIINDTRLSHLYPVSHEIWEAGNNYVGKYSKLGTLDDNYISSLQNWIMYLETGKHQSADYVDEERNVDELLKKIETYYK